MGSFFFFKKKIYKFFIQDENMIEQMQNMVNSKAREIWEYDGFIFFNFFFLIFFF